MSKLELNYIFSWIENNVRKSIIFILGSAFLVRVFSSLFTDPFHWPDATAYHNLALSILHEGIYTDTIWAPLYPYFLSVIYYFFDVNVPIVMIIQSIIGSISCLFLFLIVRNLINIRVGIISAIFLAVYPFHIYLSGVLLTEGIFIFLLLIWIYLILKIVDNRSFFGIVTGIILGLLILTRPVALVLVPTSFFFLLIGQSLDWKRVFFYWFLMMAFCLFTLSPWIVKSYTERGVIIISSKAGGYNFWRGNNPLAGATDTMYLTASVEVKGELLRMHGVDPKQLNIQRNEKLYYKAALNWIRENPTKFVLNYFKKFINFWRLTPDQVTKVKSPSLIKIGSIFILLILYFTSILGIFLSRTDYKRMSIIYLAIIAFPLGLSFFITSFRSRMVIDPFLIIFSALSVSHGINKSITRNIV